MKLIKILAKPGAKKVKVEKQNDFWIVCLKSKPKQGLANAELIKVLAEHFNLPQSCVRIKSGFKSKIKTVVLDDD